MVMSDRSFSNEKYRWGFNGKETDNEVKGNGNSLDFGARIYDSRLGRWLSVDPLASKYIDLSPFNFVDNNPLVYVDPNGKEIQLILSRDKDGNALQILKYKGNKFYTSDGKEFKGNDGFVTTVLNSLNELKKIEGKNVKELVTALEVSSNIHYVEKDPYESNRVTPLSTEAGLKGTPTGTHIMVTLGGDELLDGTPSTSETTLAHELRHSYDYDKGNMKDNSQYNDSKDPAEIRAVNFENRVRKAKGLPIRTKYGNDAIDTKKLEDPSKPSKL